MRFLKILVQIIIIICIPISSIFTSAFIVGSLPDFYSYEFTKLQSLQEADVNVSEIEMGELFSKYMTGRTEEFQLEAEYENKVIQLFNSKEQSHMKDVRNLIWLIGISAICAFIIIIVCTLFLNKKSDNYTIRRGYIFGIGTFLLFIVALFIFSKLDFTKGFNAFHEIFFTNDLWMLNPNEDILLMIMPEQFFIDSMFIVILFSIPFLILTGLIIWRFTKERAFFKRNVE